MGYTLEEINEENPRVTKGHVKHELRMHGASWEEFKNEQGDRENYFSRDVLEWLGY